MVRYEAAYVVLMSGKCDTLDPVAVRVVLVALELRRRIAEDWVAARALRAWEELSTS